MLEVVALGSL